MRRSGLACVKRGRSPEQVAPRPYRPPGTRHDHAAGRDAAEHRGGAAPGPRGCAWPGHCTRRSPAHLIAAGDGHPRPRPRLAHGCSGSDDFGIRRGPGLRHRVERLCAGRPLELLEGRDAKFSRTGWPVICRGLADVDLRSLPTQEVPSAPAKIAILAKAAARYYARLGQSTASSAHLTAWRSRISCLRTVEAAAFAPSSSSSNSVFGMRSSGIASRIEKVWLSSACTASR